MPRAVVQLVNIFNCHVYDWSVKDEWKVAVHHQRKRKGPSGSYGSWIYN